MSIPPHLLKIQSDQWPNEHNIWSYDSDSAVCNCFTINSERVDYYELQVLDRNLNHRHCSFVILGRIMVSAVVLFTKVSIAIELR